MWNNQTSERQLKKDQDKLKNQKVALEGLEIIKKYLGWLILPYSEKEKIRKEWEEYYKKVSKTTSAKEYFELRNYWPPSSKKAKKLIDNARKRLEDKKWELALPQSTDPLNFYQGVCSKYQYVCNQIQSINKKLTGVEDVAAIFKSTPLPVEKEIISPSKLPYKDN